MGWCRVAVRAHIPPAGVVAAKPVRIRRCPATVMLPPGREPGRLGADVNAALGGRAVRAASAAEPPPPLTRRFFYVQHSPEAGRSPCLVLLASLAAPACGVARRRPAAATARRQARPRRIVSLSPTATETLFAIGAGQQVRRRRRPVELPGRGAAHEARRRCSPNAEAIADYRPDLVVTPATTGLVATLRKLGMPVLVQPPARTLDEAYAQIARLGGATGHAAAARRLVARMRARIEALVARAAQARGRRVYHELTPEYFSATSKTFIGRVYALFGLRNIADEAAKAAGSGYPQLSGEYVLAPDPDLIVLADTKCCDQSAATVARRPGWARMSAVRARPVSSSSTTTSPRAGARASSASSRRSRTPCVELERLSGAPAQAQRRALGAAAPRSLLAAAASGRSSARWRIGAGRRGAHARGAPAAARRRPPADPLARRASCGTCGCRASCSARSSARCWRSRAAPTRASSATRSPTRTCSGSRPAPASARRSRSPTGPPEQRASLLLPVAAFAGAAGERRRSRMCSGARPARRGAAVALILAGVTVASFFTALQTFVLQQHSDEIRDGLRVDPRAAERRGWRQVAIVLPYVALSSALLLAHAGVLDVMRVGDEEAAALGVDVGRTRAAVVVGATVGTSAAVAVSGLIGFVGIVVPHAIRLAARRQLPLRPAALDPVGGAAS